ncbi:MAG: hypothetical protein HYT80_05060 [Euryarchaeota archaeon]|nr:hypothetical protein [Euryarchaeota archaeon]
MRVPLGLAVAALFFAGCLETPANPSEANAAVVSSARIVVAGQTLDATDGYRFDGKLAAGSGDACGFVNCDKAVFELELDDAFVAANQLKLEASVRWHFADDVSYKIRLLREGKDVDQADWNSYASIVLDEDPKPGTYTVEVIAVQGKARYEAIVQLEARPKAAPPREIAPNLVGLAPDELTLESYGDVVPSSVARGCYSYEIIEQGARRCLRVSTALGNAGEGQLQVHMVPLEGAKAGAGMGRYTQRIFSTDGSFRDVPVGLGAFHPTHRHFHYNGLAQFTVYQYDLDAEKRGEQVAQSRKNGFCFVDMGLVALGLPGTTYSGNHESACFTPRQNGGWITGISPNWYDLYWNDLDDQYVDIQGVPDGTYELVFMANAEKTIVETTMDDNEASAVFSLKNNQVKVLKRIDGFGAH